MYSMTGYGKAVYNEGGLEITVEMKSVNNRFLDLNSKYPRSFVSFDDSIRKTVQSKLAQCLFFTKINNPLVLAPPPPQAAVLFSLE